MNLKVEEIIGYLHPSIQAYIKELQSYRKVREPDYSKAHTPIGDTLKDDKKPYFHYNKNGEKVVYMGPKLVLFLDMDGVLFNFHHGIKDPTKWNPPEMFEKGFFLNRPVNPGAKEFVEWAMSQTYLDVFIASKPLTEKVFYSATEKMEAVSLHFPALVEKMMLVADKGYILGDMLVDDDDWRWKDKFKGEFFQFDRDNTAESFKKLKELLELRQG